MLRFAQIVGATALFSHSVLAAPAVRRDDSYGGNSYSKSSDDSYKQASSYGQDSYNKGSDWSSSQPSYDNKYSQPSYDSQSNSYGNQYSQPSYDNKYTTDDSYSQTDDSYSQAYQTTTASYSSSTYGSGQQQWGQSYGDCVSKCVAQYGSPPQYWQPSANIPPPAGTGAVHTVMVAPMQGVLRYWPFAVNASVGDTIRYVWSNPANHTVTLSSALLPCNKSALAEELKWVSGVRNSTGGVPNIFDVNITTNDTQFFYCGVAEHCEKGMFGMVQPQMGGNNTVSSLMQGWLDSNPDLQAAWSYVHNQTQGTPYDTWGNDMSMDGVPESSYMNMAQNIIWSRAMFAANPGAMEANSATTSDGSPIKIVGDLNSFLASTSQDPPASVPQGTPTGSVPVASDVAPSLSATKASAGFKTSASVWVAAFVGAVSYLVL